ncbi:MAG: glycosyltransferase family 87 protein [Anaerolineae bacterium]
MLALAVAAKAVVQPHQHSVYPVFAAGARLWWADASLYDEYEGLGLFRYSPTFAVAMTPLALLSDRVGGVLWGLMSVGLLFWAIRRLVRDVLPGAWPPRQEGLLLGLALVNAVRGLWSLQSNALLIAGVLLAASLIARGRWWPASLLLACATFIKIWPLAAAMLLMAGWPRQLIGRYAACAAGLAMVPFLTRPWGVVLRQYGDWWAMLARTRVVRWPGYRDAWTIWETLWPPVEAHLYIVLQLLTALGVLGWCAWQYRQTECVRRRLTAVLAIWTAWQLLFGPGSERLTYLIVAPLTAWAVVASRGLLRRLLAFSAWLMTGLLGTGGVQRAVEPLAPGAVVILPLGVAVFVIWVLAHRWETACS